MNLKSTLTARKAAGLQSKGDLAGAMELYDKAITEGLEDPTSILRYTVLLIRDGQFQKARDLLVQIQNKPMSDENKNILLSNYATCVYKQGDLDKGIRVLEGRHRSRPCGLVYETLGYLLVESGDYRKALNFNLEALDYDDEDPIVLDNLAQTYYRLGHEWDKARTYFTKAHELKEGQIDTLWFLSRYDLKDGKRLDAAKKLEKALEGRFSPLNFVTKAMVEEELARLQTPGSEKTDGPLMTEPAVVLPEPEEVVEEAPAEEPEETTEQA